ncbi:MAG: Smr/MutS family protein [Rhodobacteraceae bacterium]|nr:Smr/MutS family protein [Paracoccaceae bacterium]
MTRRKLSPEERELWQQIANQTRRLHPEMRRPDKPEKSDRPVPPVKPSKLAMTRIDRFEMGANGTPPPHRLQAPLGDRLAAAPVQMDRKAFGRMKRGKLVPESRIDLHGMTLDRAHPALNRFILAAQASGKRLVLVITGKGRDRPQDGPIPVPRGILKHQVPMWLRSPPLAQAVLQISEAHVSHGGGGAYYVYLRRAR